MNMTVAANTISKARLSLIEAFQLLENGQNSEARLALAKVIESHNDQSSTAARFLAHIDQKERKFAQAIATLLIAHLEFPQDPKILNQLAEYSMDLGDYEKAIEYAEQSLSINPDNKILSLNLAGWYSSRSNDPLDIRSRFEEWSKKYLDPICLSFQPHPFTIYKQPPIHLN